jgi:hypothetical protein
MTVRKIEAGLCVEVPGPSLIGGVRDFLAQGSLGRRIAELERQRVQLTEVVEDLKRRVAVLERDAMPRRASVPHPDRQPTRVRRTEQYRAELKEGKS